MCGRYRLSRIDLLLAAYRDIFRGTFEEFSEIHITHRFNIAPSQNVPIIRATKDGTPKLELARWGFIPSWTKGKPKSAPINAKAETVDTSGMFRQAFARRRCLVPADGFYEWQGARPPRRPFFIHKTDDSLFCFAGLWEQWRGSESAEPLDTFTIITTTPNSLIEKIHNRMPVILRPQNYSAWLNETSPQATIKAMLKPYSDSELEAYPVSPAVNSPKYDGPELTKRDTSGQ